MHTDREIPWVRRRLYIPAAQLGNGSLGGLTMTQYPSTPFYGIKETTTGTVREFVFGVPKDLNPDFPVGIRLRYIVSGTTCTSGTFIVLADVVKDGAAALASAATALDTTVGLQTFTGTWAGKVQKTSRGIKNGGFATRTDVYATAWFQMSYQLSAVGGTQDTSNTVYVLGLQIDYAAMMTRYPHSDVDQPLADDPL